MGLRSICFPCAIECEQRHLSRVRAGERHVDAHGLAAVQAPDGRSETTQEARCAAAPRLLRRWSEKRTGERSLRSRARLPAIRLRERHRIQAVLRFRRAIAQALVFAIRVRLVPSKSDSGAEPLLRARLACAALIDGEPGSSLAAACEKGTHAPAVEARARNCLRFGFIPGGLLFLRARSDGCEVVSADITRA